jgi:hypothetical protein
MYIVYIPPTYHHHRHLAHLRRSLTLIYCSYIKLMKLCGGDKFTTFREIALATLHGITSSTEDVTMENMINLIDHVFENIGFCCLDSLHDMLMVFYMLNFGGLGSVHNDFERLALSVAALLQFATSFRVKFKNRVKIVTCREAEVAAHFLLLFNSIKI